MNKDITNGLMVIIFSLLLLVIFYFAVILNTLSFNQEILIFGDLFFVLSFICLRYLKNKVYLIIPISFAMVLEDLWQLPSGLIIGIIVLQYLSIKILSIFYLPNNFNLNFYCFITSYTACFIPFKLYFFPNNTVYTVLIEILLTILLYPVILSLIWQMLKVFKQCKMLMTKSMQN